MAWRLLCVRTLEIAVTRSLLSALVVYAIGCVVPTPLEAGNNAPYPPTVIKGEPLDFGSIPEDARDQMDWYLGVVASDPNPSHMLSARLYWKNGNNYTRMADDIVLTSFTGLTNEDKTRREGSFTRLQYCKFLGNDVERFVYVYVSNGTYPGSTNNFPCAKLVNGVCVDEGAVQPSALTPGTFSFNYWAITCQ